MKKTAPAKDVSAYLAALPKEQRAALQKLRKTIKSAAPKATEVISYRIPVYKHCGMLVGFAAFKNHCSFFVMGREAMQAHKEELQRYSTATGTVHFTPAKPLPAGLVRRLVRARIAENESRWKRKESAYSHERGRD